MKAIQITSLDGPDAIELKEVPEPTPAVHDVVIDVHAAGVSFPEVLLSRGLYQVRPELPFIPGNEVAGIVRSAPTQSNFTVGDRVVAFPGFGGFAETVAVHHSLVFPLPDSTSFALGAGLPVNYLTMQFAYRERANLLTGETVLVHGGAGGIGTAALQLAKFYGARTIAVVSSLEKEKIALAAGADQVVSSEGFREVLIGTRIDVVVDPVGGDRFTDSLRILAPGGRLLVIGFTAGAIPEVKVNRLLLNNISVVGVAWGAYWMGRDLSYPGQQWDEILPGIADGRLAPPITAEYSLDDTSAALSALEQRRALGKIVVKVR